MLRLFIKKFPIELRIYCYEFLSLLKYPNYVPNFKCKKLLNFNNLKNLNSVNNVYNHIKIIENNKLLFDIYYLKRTGESHLNIVNKTISKGLYDYDMIYKIWTV